MPGNLSPRIKAVLDHRRSRGRARGIVIAGIAITGIITVAVLAPLRPTGPPHKAAESTTPQPPAAAPTVVAALPSEPAPTPVSAPPLPADTPLTFSNVRVTGGEDPHAYGRKIEICGKDGQWSGFMTEFTGLPADAPAAKLEGLRLDQASGRLSFSTQLAVGLEIQSGRMAPAQRRYEFSGSIGEDAMAGALAVKPVEPSTVKPTREDVVLAWEAAGPESAPSCAKWLEAWNRRLEHRRFTSTAAPLAAAARTPRGIVSDIENLMRSALADDATSGLDEIMRPITGLHHVQRHARAALDDAGGDPANLAANYIEVINALTNTANQATNVAAGPQAGLSPQRLQQLAASMRARAAELVDAIMPASATRPASFSTPEQRAASAALELVQATQRDTTFVGPANRSWLNTDLATLERAARAVIGDDGAAPAVSNLKLELLRSSIRSTSRQANEIARRGGGAAERRSKAAALVASLRGVERQFDDDADDERVLPEVPVTGMPRPRQRVRISGDDQHDRPVTWDSARFGLARDDDRCEGARCLNAAE